MSIRRMLTETITLLTPGTTTDPYGSTQSTWTTGTNYPALMEQTSGTEVTKDRDTQQADWVLYLEAGVPITGDSRVVYLTNTYEVLGPPDQVTSPLDVGVHHIEARVRHVTG